ncbi:DUF4224 domain-containing protein [Paraburkholderia caledonica]|uniref:DUF4224 domain-containing protein n=1 Tax=Paraburkholderia caledonica TaxID=134536 RepID=UPI003709B33F
MHGYLLPSEIADLVGRKPNQRKLMTRWSASNGWPYVIDRNGIPKVARAYHDRKLGINTEPASTRFDAGPHLDAFKPLEGPKRR